MAKKKDIKVGDKVKVVDGLFKGMTGTVERTESREGRAVTFNGRGHKIPLKYLSYYVRLYDRREGPAVEVLVFEEYQVEKV